MIAQANGFGEATGQAPNNSKGSSHPDHQPTEAALAAVLPMPLRR
jgi:hypothetical protein